MCPTAGGAREGVGQRRSSIRLNVSEKTLSLPRGEQTARSACGLRGGRLKTVSASFQEGRTLGTARGSVYGGRIRTPICPQGRTLLGRGQEVPRRERYRPSQGHAARKGSAPRRGPLQGAGSPARGPAGDFLDSAP